MVEGLNKCIKQVPVLYQSVAKLNVSALKTNFLKVDWRISEKLVWIGDPGL